LSTLGIAIKGATSFSSPKGKFADTSTFEDKATQWFCNLLLNKNDNLDDKIGVDNGILVAYGMCPPCELLVPHQELS
jgi:hypothetical protein